MKPGPRVTKWLDQSLTLGKCEWEAALGFPLTELFPPPDISCYFSEASTERWRRRENERRRRKERRWKYDQMKNRKKSGGFIDTGQETRHHFQAVGGMQISHFHSWWIKDTDDFLLATHLREPLCITCPSLSLSISSHSPSWEDCLSRDCGFVTTDAWTRSG